MDFSKKLPYHFPKLTLGKFLIPDFPFKLLILLATPGGLEPPTFSLEGCCSNPLSYGAVALRGPAGATRAR